MKLRLNQARRRALTLLALNGPCPVRMLPKLRIAERTYNALKADKLVESFPVDHPSPERGAQVVCWLVILTAKGEHVVTGEIGR